MSGFLQQVVSGLAAGGVYGSLALALVLIHRATGVINFAQGEMATFTTYIAWTLTTNHGIPYWPAVLITLVSPSRGGIGIHQAVIRPLERRLGAARRRRHDRAAPRPQRPHGLDLVGRAAVDEEPVRHRHDHARRRRDRVAGRRDDRRLARRRRPALGALPVHEGRARAPGRGDEPGRGAPRRRARPVDAVARLGPRRRPRRDQRPPRRLPAIDPNLMQPVLIYAFAAAVLGGIDSPIGAVVGGLSSASGSTSSARTSTSSAPTCGCRRRSSSSSACCSCGPPALRPHGG